MRLFVLSADRYDEKPLYEVIVQKCRELGIAGATVFRGLEGFGNSAEIHRAHLLSHDLPIGVTIVDSEQNIQRLLPVVEAMMDSGLIAISDVEVLRTRKPGR